MFFAIDILSRKGALGRVWLAAHDFKRLTKSMCLGTKIEKCVEIMMDGVPTKEGSAPISLRLNGHLLLGIVRIYSKKSKYLLTDIHDALTKIKMAFRPGAVELAPEASVADYKSITLPVPETMMEIDMMLPDLAAPIFPTEELEALTTAPPAMLDLEEQPVEAMLMTDDFMELPMGIPEHVALEGPPETPMERERAAAERPESVARLGETPSDVSEISDFGLTPMGEPLAPLEEGITPKELPAFGLEEMPALPTPEQLPVGPAPEEVEAELEREEAALEERIRPPPMPKRVRGVIIDAKTELDSVAMRALMKDRSALLRPPRPSLPREFCTMKTLGKRATRAAERSHLYRVPHIPGLAPPLCDQYEEMGRYRDQEARKRERLELEAEEEAEEKARAEAEVEPVEPGLPPPEEELPPPPPPEEELGVPAPEEPIMEAVTPAVFDFGDLETPTTAGEFTPASIEDMTPAPGYTPREDSRWTNRSINVMKHIRSTFARAETPTGEAEGVEHPIAEPEEVSLHQMLEGAKRRTAALAFFELLTIKSRGYIGLRQDVPYGDIFIAKTDRFSTSPY